jgi:hypothetical protein
MWSVLRARAVLQGVVGWVAGSRQMLCGLLGALVVVIDGGAAPLDHLPSTTLRRVPKQGTHAATRPAGLQGCDKRATLTP